MEDVGIVAPTPSFARLASMSAKPHEVGDHIRVSMGIYGGEIVDGDDQGCYREHQTDNIKLISGATRRQRSPNNGL
jgi:hypothetical protein